ncbi:unnamed protein product [Rotaria sp. Silwood1]|nr:unnamed protein product [Rotaria sp. Silwood1]
MFQQSSFRGGPMHLGRRTTWHEWPKFADGKSCIKRKIQEQSGSNSPSSGSNTSSFNRNNSWKYSATNSDLPPPTTLPSLIVPQNTVGPCRGNFYNNPNYNEPPTSLSV